MPTYFFTVYEVDSSYYYTDAQSPILSKDTLEITDSVDDDLHRSQAEDPQNDQTFSFSSESPVTDYMVQYLDFAQVNGSGQEFELYCMEATFSDGSTKYYVMSKDEGFDPNIGDDLAVTTYSSFTSTTYGEIGAAVCYSTGTNILTSSGEVAIESLKAGDLVQTKDNGCKEILWIGKRALDQSELSKAEQLRPVLIKEGVLGNSRPLLVSQQHRMLVTRQQFGESLPWSEAFVRAKHLAEYCRKSARIAHGKRSVCYYHILLGAHEVIFADGAESESLFPGPMALKGVSRKDRREIETLFPELLRHSSAEALGDFELSRPTVPRKTFKKQSAAGGCLVQGFRKQRNRYSAANKKRKKFSGLLVDQADIASCLTSAPMGQFRAT